MVGKEGTNENGQHQNKKKKMDMKTSVDAEDRSKKQEDISITGEEER